METFEVVLLFIEILVIQSLERIFLQVFFVEFSMTRNLNVYSFQSTCIIIRFNFKQFSFMHFHVFHTLFFPLLRLLASMRKVVITHLYLNLADYEILTEVVRERLKNEAKYPETLS